MTEALVIDLPDDPLHYLIEWLKIDNTRKIHATIIGPPGSGKRMLGKSCDPHVILLTNHITSFLANHVAGKTGAIRIDEKEILSSVYNPDVIRILNYQKENKSFDPMLWVKPIINRLEQTGSSTYRKFRFDLRLRNYRFFRTRECSESIDCPKKRCHEIIDFFERKNAPKVLIVRKSDSTKASILRKNQIFRL